MNTAKLLGAYTNGNYKVILLSDGTKIRHNNSNELIPDDVESMDIKITDYCDMNCPMCFPPETQILKANLNTEAINTIQVGDLVKSYNSHTHTFEDKEVKNIFCHQYEGDLICIECADGNVLKCTPNHKILSKRGWIEAQHLSESDDIIKF